MYSKGTSAYKLDTPVVTERKKTKKVVKKKKTGNMSSIALIFAVFAVMFVICLRFVNIYGKHDEITKKTEELYNLTTRNEQMEVAIRESVDSAKIEAYAVEHLGLRKIENRQIKYLVPTQDNVMVKVAKTGGKSPLRGIFGVFTGVLEYLR